MMRRPLLLLAIIVVGSTLAAPAGQDKPEGEPQGHLEQPRDRHLPTPPQPPAARHRAQIVHNGHVSVQVNVDASGNNIVGDAANEPSIAVDPADPTQIAIGWRQFDNIASDFRQAGYGYTNDGGYSWTFPGVIEPGVFRSDPVLDSDADGNFFYNSLTADDGPSNFRCHVYKSTDGGETWDAGVYAYGGDKQWQVIDTTDGIGRDNIYAAWNSFYSACSGGFTRSYDGGQSFQPCTTVAGDPQWGVLAVGPDGELYVSGTGMTLAKSTTMQDSSQPAAWDFSTTVDLDGSLEYSIGPNPAGLLGQNWIAVDHSDGPTRGNVYMLASVDRSSTADPLDVMFARSEDGGVTWSAPVRINDDPGTNAWQWFGTMSVAPNGRIDAVWLDTRNDTSGGYLSQLFYSYSTDAGVSWSPNEELTPQFDPHVGWPQQNKMGDYFDMISDDLGANLAYAATFNGEQDVYFIRIGDPSCPDDGRLTLDRPKYACDGMVEIVVLDCGLNLDDEQVEQVVVSVDSDSETGIETVTLSETSAASARFEGSIALSETDAAGVLLITEGDTVTVTYIDADDGAGGTDVPVIEQAPVECTPPLIFNVQTTDIGPRSATVTFETDEVSRGVVHYGAACGSLTESAGGSGFSTSPAVPLAALSESSLYYFAVEAADEAGNVASDDNGGACYTFSTPDIPDFFTEQFESDNDLDLHRLTFQPNGSVDFYAGCQDPIASFPTDPAGGTVLTLSDDGNALVTLSGASVSLYGTSYDSFYVGANGYITFTASDGDYSETLADHFDLPRVSALFDDLNPSSGGTVSWLQLADRAVVTWEGVPEYSTTNSNDLQIELFYNGVIAINLLNVAATDGLVGLSEGNGLPAEFYETDLSGMISCGGAACFDGVLGEGEERIDCGGPCPPCQCLSDGECDDGAFCTGSEICNEYGSCVVGSDPCAVGLHCVEWNNRCVDCIVDVHCDDGQFCNGVEICHYSNSCMSGPVPCPWTTCDDAGDVCVICDGDGLCEPGEDCANCPNDCIKGSAAVCGNGVCEAGDGETCVSCPDDCNGKQTGLLANQYCCGDGLTGTNPVTCADARCVDGGNTCTMEENLAYCCGDTACEDIESVGNCPADCTATVPGEAGAGAPLLVTAFDQTSGMMSISYGVPCAAADHTIEYGELTRINLESYAWSGQECGLGIAGVYDWATGGMPDALFFVVVANNGVEEGSYGQGSTGFERGEDATSATCPMPQNLQYACE
jgi:hypothetical protein